MYNASQELPGKLPAKQPDPTKNFQSSCYQRVAVGPVMTWRATAQPNHLLQADEHQALTTLVEHQ
jgi:hypothetical protein